MKQFPKYLILASLTLILLSILATSAEEQPSPSDWVKDNQIHIYKNTVQLDIPGAVWVSFTNTNSMDPVLDETAHALEIKPEPNLIQIGDIISYKKNNAIYVHRVTEISEDNSGLYYLVKGDNAFSADLVRFNDIQGVIVAVIY